LRKIPQHPSAAWIELLSEQANVVTARKEPIEHLLSVGITSLQDVVLKEPKAACQKGAFARREAISGIVGLVSQDEFFIDQQLLFDRMECPPNAWIICRKKADDWYQKQTCVEPFRSVGLYEAP
jgi:hypothetical protein